MIRCIALLFLCVMISCITFSQITDPSPYCSSTYGSTSSYPALLKVEIDSFINATSHTLKPSYMYYNNLTSVNIQRNDSSNIKLTYNNVDQETMIIGWIDFDNDL